MTNQNANIVEAAGRAADGQIAEWRAGWPSGVASALGYGAGVTLFTNTATVFIAPLMSETGWTTTEVIISPIIITIAGLLCPSVGWFVEKRGARYVALVGHFGLILVISLFAALAPLNHFTYYSFAVMVGILGSCAYLVPYSRAIASWFDRSAGKAFGLLGVAGSGLPALTTPLVAVAVYKVGWRCGFLVVAGVMLCVAVPAVSWALEIRRNKLSGHFSPVDYERQGERTERFGLLQAYKVPRLWFLGLWSFLVCVGQVGFSANIQPLMLSEGRSVVQATAATSLFFVSIVLSRVAVGVLLDLVSRYVLAVSAFLLCLGGALILANGATASFPRALTGTALLAIGQGAESNMMSYFVLKEFGSERFAVMFGAFIPMITAGAFVGPYLFGWIRDRTDSYSPACYTAAGCFALTIILVALFGYSGRRRTLGSGRVRPEEAAHKISVSSDT